MGHSSPLHRADDIVEYVSYDHSLKAGNPGDVWKHFLLVELLAEINTRSETIRYADSHCGAPCHQLGKKGEWAAGIGRVIAEASCDCRYLAIAREWMETNQYPAGWVFAARQFAARFSNVELYLFDQAAEVASAYPPVADDRLPSNLTIHFKRADGYASTEVLARVDLVFLDPPYYPSAASDWQSITLTCQRLNERGIDFIAWYPLKRAARPQALVDSTCSTAWEIQWRGQGPKPTRELKGCGMLISGGLAPTIDRMCDAALKMADCTGSRLTLRRPGAQSAARESG